MFSQRPRRDLQFFPGLLLVILALLASLGVAQEEGHSVQPNPESASVGGFDRFARHGELSEELAGSLLISELSCAGCHVSSDQRLQPKLGPRLHSAGLRLDASWMRAFLSDPLLMKHATTMPDLLSTLPDSQRRETLDALVAFLTSQLQPFAEIKATGAVPVIHEFWNRGDVGRGRDLYHRVGCVACHDPDAEFETSQSAPSPIDKLIADLDPEELADLGLDGEARRVESIPHGDLNHKYSHRSLTMFLFNPSEVRPAARMPSLRLAPSEAADIAAYLLRDQVAVVAAEASQVAPRSLIDMGRERFRSLGCAACHEATGVAPIRFAKPLADLDVAASASCIHSPDGAMPRYMLDDEQRKAIVAKLESTQPQQASVSEDVHFRMLQLNCYACHRRDARGGVGRFRKPYFETVGQVDLGDEGRLPPTLAGVGRKLQPKALESVFAESTAPHRPYMQIRMPSYAKDSIRSLVSGLPIADQVDADRDTEVFSLADSLAVPGRDLANTGCVGCHPFRGEALPGVVGIDLAGITNRVHPRWFADFVLSPSEVKERTRMPTFFPYGQSNRKELLDGDVHQQISALWVYLKNLDNEPLPDKIDEVRSANYELMPSDTPVVLRTFMHQAGTHAIAVGFPAGVHYAFDSEQVRLAIAWKGRFLDARGTWFERFTPPADPIGAPVVQLPPGPLLVPDHGRIYQFDGYRLDHKAVPTFLYRYGKIAVEDRIEATGDKTQGGLKRMIKLTSSNSNSTSATTTHDRVLLQAHAATQLIAVGATSFRDDAGLTVAVAESELQDANLRQNDSLQRWLIPLEINGTRTIELEYRW